MPKYMYCMQLLSSRFKVRRYISLPWLNDLTSVTKFAHNHHHSLFSTMLILSESDVRQCLDMKHCIDMNRKALIAIASGDAIVPTRLGLPYHSNNTNNINETAEDWTLFKPASLQQTTTTSTESNTETLNKTNIETISMGMKVVSVRANNVNIGHPLVPATIVHIHPQTGIVDAIIAATYLTAVRTAAGSALAIQHYFRQYNDNDDNNNNNTTNVSSSITTAKSSSPQHVVVFGAGLQAEQHLRAIACIFDYCIPKVTIINRNVQRAESLKHLLLSEIKPIIHSCTIEPLASSNTHRIEETILPSADVIVTCTNTLTPLWGMSNSKSLFTHNQKCIITGIGSYTPTMQEVPEHVVNQCQQIWIDTSEAINVGDLKHLLLITQQSNIDQSTNYATLPTPQLLGSILLQHNQHSMLSKDDTSNGNIQQNKNDISGLVFYKAVGTAIQDILSADDVVKRANEFGIGTNIDMF